MTATTKEPKAPKTRLRNGHSGPSKHWSRPLMAVNLIGAEL
jgi:hypothetical protein